MTALASSVGHRRITRSLTVELFILNINGNVVGSAVDLQMLNGRGDFEW